MLKAEYLKPEANKNENSTFGLRLIQKINPEQVAGGQLNSGIFQPAMES